MRRLDDERQAKALGQSGQLMRSQQHFPRRRGQAACLPHLLGADLVDGHGRCHDPRTGVGNAQHLQNALDGAVLAVAAMQRNEGAVVAGLFQVAQRSLRRIEGLGIDPLGLEGLQHIAAGIQRDIALGRMSAHQHHDASQRVGVDLHGERQRIQGFTHARLLLGKAWPRTSGPRSAQGWHRCCPRPS